MESIPKCSSEFSTPQTNKFTFLRICIYFLPFTHNLLTRFWLSATIMLLNQIPLKVTNGLLIAKYNSPYSVPILLDYSTVLEIINYPLKKKQQQNIFLLLSQLSPLFLSLCTSSSFSVLQGVVKSLKSH